MSTVHDPTLRLIGAALIVASLAACGHAGPTPAAAPPPPAAAIAPMEPGAAAIALRQASMRDLDARMGAVARSLAEQGSADAMRKALLDHVGAVDAMSRDLPALFPPGTGAAPSRARVEVWTQSERFQRSAAEFRAALKRFEEAAAGATEVAQVRSAWVSSGVEASCSGCHAAFRQDVNPGAAR